MKFDTELFGMKTAHYRRVNKISLRDAAKEIGISAASLSRIERGRRPDIDSFVKIVMWAGWIKNVEQFTKK